MAAFLGDFGGAKLILPHVEDGTVGCLSLDMTTRWYAAPEVLLRNEAYGFASDVWSLGISIAEMEMGHAPFRCRYDFVMMVHILRVFGTPADGQWSELTRTPTCCGEL